jgi:thymidylate kinase
VGGSPDAAGKEPVGTAHRVSPSGLWVAILGPDGSGKSSVIAQYVPLMEHWFGGSACFHLRPRILSGGAHGQIPNTDPHGQALRGAVISSAKVLYLCADYVLGYWFRVRPLLVASKLVVFDRYYHDLLIDPRRFRYGGPRWLAHAVARLIPMPDLVLILDAPAEVLQARKREVSVEESARQSAAYRAAALSTAMRGRVLLIDAARPLDQVAQACADGTMALAAMSLAGNRRS